VIDKGPKTSIVSYRLPGLVSVLRGLRRM